MQATRVLQNLDAAFFGPEALKVIGQAFDEAGSDIADDFRGETLSLIEAVRLMMAVAIIALANEGSRDVETLKRAGLRAVQNI